MWNICSSKWVHLPQFFGVKIPKNGWNQLPDYLNDWMHWQLNSPVHMIKLPLNHRKNLRFPICWWLNQLLLKNVSQIGSFPQVGMKIQNVWNLHFPMYVEIPSFPKIPKVTWKKLKDETYIRWALNKISGDKRTNFRGTSGGHPGEMFWENRGGDLTGMSCWYLGSIDYFTPI